MVEFAAHGANQEEKMAAEKAKKTIVIGHKNPDTDSIWFCNRLCGFQNTSDGRRICTVPCWRTEPGDDLRIGLL